jgi:hypothetical protein
MKLYPIVSGLAEFHGLDGDARERRKCGEPGTYFPLKSNRLL